MADVHAADLPGFVRVNAPPSYRSSQLQHSRFHPGNASVGQVCGPACASAQGPPSAGGDTQPMESAVRPETEIRNPAVNSADRVPVERCQDMRVVDSQRASRTSGDTEINSSQSPRRGCGHRYGRGEESVTPFRETQAGTGLYLVTATSATSSSSSSSLQPLPAQPQPSSSPSSSSYLTHAVSLPTAPPPTSGTALTSLRYVEPYPSCFFEEDPPPPYTPCPAFYRSPARRSCTAAPTSSAGSSSSSRNPQQQQHFQRGEPSRRTLHFIPSHSSPGHNRQIVYDGTPNRLVSYDDTPNRQFSYDDTPNRQFSYDGTPNRLVSYDGTPNIHGFSHSNQSNAHDGSHGGNGTTPASSEPPTQGTILSQSQGTILNHSQGQQTVTSPAALMSSSCSSNSPPRSVYTSIPETTCIPRDSGYSSASITTTPSTSSLGTSKHIALNIPRPQITNRNFQSSVQVSRGNPQSGVQVSRGNPQSGIQVSRGDPQSGVQVSRGNPQSGVQFVNSNPQAICMMTNGDSQDHAHLVEQSPHCSSNDRAPSTVCQAAPITPLYVIRSSQTTPSAPPPDTLPSLIHLEAPPLGTSTPVSQSPAVQRRFAPPLHPSCPRGQPFTFSSSAQEPITDCYVATDTAHQSGSEQRPSCLSGEVCHPGRQSYESPRISTIYHMPRPRHSRQTVAPLAR